ncbi:polysaccharide deacetylase family protein [Chelativorans xinjiangense]|uniref:polysaccharide deacetylase family protein n=1 Tax=Chelativorans xinjiangense TaxID=2681485 RepID=UPI001359AA0C|nr:polysaccharide deacetylase family protein [Chelativorans xinjiangense]
MEKGISRSGRAGYPAVPRAGPASRHALLHSAREFLKYAAIRTSLEAVAHSRAQALFPALGGRGVIFTLHHVRPVEGPRFAPNAHLSVTPNFLAQAIVAARECGLVPVHLHDLPALLSDPADKRKFAAFTLDDGYRNNAAFAAPVFRKFDVPYTIFLTAGFVERTRTIWWETAAALVDKSAGLTFDFGNGPEKVATTTAAQKRAAFARLEAFVGTVDEDEAVERIDRASRAAGIEPAAIVDELVMDEADLRALGKDPLARFGAHTLTHVNLRRVGSERLREEVEASARAVERYVGRPPRSFAYPYGQPWSLGEREIRAVAEAGFPLAVTTQPGVLRPASLERPTALPRVSLNGRFQAKHHVKALVSGLLFKLTQR